MRHLFHAMLGLSVGIVAAGMAEGARLRGGALDPVARPSASITDVEMHARPSVELALSPPEPLLPRYAERVGAGTTLAWIADPSAEGARLELSTSPRFDSGTVRSADVQGDRFKLPPSLPAGVWYWRLRALSEGAVGERASPPRMMFVVAAPSGEWG